MLCTTALLLYTLWLKCDHTVSGHSFRESSFFGSFTNITKTPRTEKKLHGAVCLFSPEHYRSGPRPVCCDEPYLTLIAICAAVILSASLKLKKKHHTTLLPLWLVCCTSHHPIFPPFTFVRSLPLTPTPPFSAEKIRQWWCTSEALSGPISLCLPRCTAHQGLQMRLMQLQAVPELHCEPGTQHAGEEPATFRSKLAMGNFSGVDAKYNIK